MTLSLSSFVHSSYSYFYFEAFEANFVALMFVVFHQCFTGILPVFNQCFATVLPVFSQHQGEFSLVASIKVKFLASVTKNGVLSF